MSTIKASFSRLRKKDANALKELKSTNAFQLFFRKFSLEIADSRFPTGL